MRPNHRPRAGGYTLVEVACAFAVLSVLATTVSVGEGNSIRSVARSFRGHAALNLAAGRLEELAAGAAPLAPSGWHEFAVAAAAVEHLPYHRTLERVLELEPGLFEVTAEVSWMEHSGANRDRVRLTTLIAGGSRR